MIDRYQQNWCRIGYHKFCVTPSRIWTLGFSFYLIICLKLQSTFPTNIIDKNIHPWVWIISVQLIKTALLLQSCDGVGLGWLLPPCDAGPRLLGSIQVTSNCWTSTLSSSQTVAGWTSDDRCFGDDQVMIVLQSLWSSWQHICKKNTNQVFSK